jgi:glycosyltransferase involved in cell wall biosynthesis
MATGCLIVGSATPPVLEFLSEGDNGLLVDFFDDAGLCERITQALESRERGVRLRRAARRTIVDELDFQARIRPRWGRLCEAMIAGRAPAAGAT